MVWNALHRITSATKFKVASIFIHVDAKLNMVFTVGDKLPINGEEYKILPGWIVKCFSLVLSNLSGTWLVLGAWPQ